MSTEDVLSFDGFDAIEVHNSMSVEYSNYTDDSAFYEYFLRAGGHAVPIAADDCHFDDGDKPSYEYFKGFNIVKAPSLSYENIINALKCGATYASTEPLFENLWIENDILHVEYSPVCGVHVHAKHINHVFFHKEPTDCITKTEFDISGARSKAPYIWVQLSDTRGKKAWSMPFWFK